MGVYYPPYMTLHRMGSTVYLRSMDTLLWAPSAWASAIWAALANTS